MGAVMGIKAKIINISHCSILNIIVHGSRAGLTCSFGFIFTFQLLYTCLWSLLGKSRVYLHLARESGNEDTKLLEDYNKQINLIHFVISIRIRIHFTIYKFKFYLKNKFQLDPFPARFLGYKLLPQFVYYTSLI